LRKGIAAIFEHRKLSLGGKTVDREKPIYGKDQDKRYFRVTLATKGTGKAIIGRGKNGRGYISVEKTTHRLLGGSAFQARRGGSKKGGKRRDGNKERDQRSRSYGDKRRRRGVLLR